MPHRILLVYGTSYGQTQKIAERMSEHLTQRDCIVTLVRGDRLHPDFSFTGYDGIIVGASIVVSKHQRYIQRFVRDHVASLNAVPSAFFSVSGSAGSRFDKERVAARRLLNTFLTSTGWKPRMSATIAGAIAFTKYNIVLRWFMKRISAQEGGSTDTSRDHEYTDWSQVLRFAEDFLGIVTVSRPQLAPA